MNKYTSIIFLLMLFGVSCKEKPVVIDKFIYSRVYSIVYDSTSTPCLGIIPYLQYTRGEKYKMALGKIYERESVAPPHSLIHFFESNTDPNMSELLDKNFANKEFDSTYNTYFDPRCIYFLYVTSDKKKHIITCGKGGFPNELSDVFQYLEDYISEESKWIETEPFSVDSLFLDYERNLFANYPPTSGSKNKEQSF